MTTGPEHFAVIAERHFVRLREMPMSPAIKPIETHYAGCRFRSRLEARWAIALESMGVAWEYESQGYECTYRLSLASGTFPYLPDFWLPEIGVFAEVKAELNELDLVRLCDAAASLSSNNGGGCHDAGGHDLVVLGPIPDPKLPHSPWRLHMHKGILAADPWQRHDVSYCTSLRSVNVAGDYGGASWASISDGNDFGDDPVRASAKLLAGAGVADGVADAGWRRGYRAARSARFEHGATGRDES